MNAARLRALWWNLVRREQVDAALDDELRAYVELLAAEHVRAGMTPAEARRAALVSVGGVEQVKEATRDAWFGARLVDAWRELRYALRSLGRSPAYTVTAVATLGVGIAGATAVFTVIKGTLLMPLPAATAPDRLVSIERVQRATTLYDFGYPDYVDLSADTRTLFGIAGFDGTSTDLRDAAGTTRAWVSYVTGNFFSVLGVAPALGRTLSASDAVPYVASPVVVISYKMWQERFGGSARAIGSRVEVHGYPLTVVGVAPKGFVGGMTLHHMDLWIPFTMIQAVFGMNDPYVSRGDAWLRLVGRLKPGFTAADAQRDLADVMQRLGTVHTEDHGRSALVYANAGMTREERDEASRLPRLLAIAVALLLLIACANVASLALVRAGARRRELATRLALGASRGSLVGRLLIEGAVVAAGGAVVGVALAQLIVRVASITLTIVDMDNPDVSLDWRVLAVALMAAAFTTLAVSLTPALQVARVPAAAVLKDGGRGGRRRSMGQRSLVAIQVATSLVLLLSAATVAASIRRVLAADSGFDIRSLSYAWLDPEQFGKDTTREREFYRGVLARAAAEPTFAGAAITSTVPPEEWGTRGAVFRDGEQPTRAAFAGHDFDYDIRSYLDFVSPTLFDVMRIPIVRGRAFSDADDANAPPVAIVSRRLADALWPSQNPIGRMLVWPSEKGPERPAMRVVGVAADTRHAALTEDPPYVTYVPLAQHFVSYAALVVRPRAGGGGAGGGAVPGEVMQRTIGGVNPSRGTRLADMASGQLDPQRRASTWIGVFGGIALVLAAIGLYGVVAQGVQQRTRELAVRSALGASPMGILGLVFKDGLGLAAIGAAAGLALGAAAMRVAQSQLSGVALFDAKAALAAAGVLMLAMLAAVYVPAQRAARLSAADVLRSD